MKKSKNALLVEITAAALANAEYFHKEAKQEADGARQRYIRAQEEESKQAEKIKGFRAALLLAQRAR